MSNYPVDMSVKPDVKAFFDPDTNTISYVVKDPGSNACAVIDSVMDIDYAAGRITYGHADEIIAWIKSEGLELEWIIETHVHADHLSAAPYIQQKLGGKIGIGDQIMVVQDTFGKVFNEGTEFQRDGSQFDALFKDGDTYRIGGMTAFAMYTPGHTPACMVHVMGDAAFVGDTLFMPDGGSARADFPGGDAGQLYDSIQKVLALPTRCACSCAMITAPMAAISSGKPPWAMKKPQHSCRRRQKPRGVHPVSHRARQAARHASADYPVVTGQHARR
jgi:glyoxylase-like metal-dependent hydrolase (beta-lactamase superfamily II)